MREDRVRWVRLPPPVWIELLLVACWLPAAQFNTSVGWNTRVATTDACLTGQGWAWTRMPLSFVGSICRAFDRRGAYTNLSLPHGLALADHEAHQIRSVRWPTKNFHWIEVSRRAWDMHITIEEADALNWEAEDSLRRPDENYTR